MNSEEQQRIPSLQTEQTPLVTLEQRLQAVHVQLAQLHQELIRIQQTQLTHTESLHKLERIALRGRWLRRIGLLFRLAIITAILYFLVNWDALLYLLV